MGGAGTAANVREWIEGDESGKDMLRRTMQEHPLLSLPPPLHRLPLRLRNVLEILGPSPSAKTLILMQTAISCILPDEFLGVYYGGFERLVFFIDLDCRFDISRFSHLLKSRILEANRIHYCGEEFNHFPQQLYVMCMRRFIYIRCYDSIQFLSTLKTLPFQLQKEIEAQGVSPLFLMIDSIGAFYWADRSLSSVHVASSSRKCLSFQTILETVVQEIKKVLLLHPMLVLSTKATILGNRVASGDLNWDVKSPSLQESSTLRTGKNDLQQFQYREYMPSVWQSFITQRLLVQPPDEQTYRSKHNNQSVFTCEWLLPSLGSRDGFVVKDDGIFCDR